MSKVEINPEEESKPSEKSAKAPAFDAIAAIHAAYPITERGTIWDIKSVGSDGYRINLRKETPAENGGLVMRPIVMSQFIECFPGKNGEATIKVRMRQ
jgi:hypothetical protein